MTQQEAEKSDPMMQYWEFEQQEVEAPTSRPGGSVSMRIVGENGLSYTNARRCHSHRFVGVRVREMHQDSIVG